MIVVWSCPSLVFASQLTDILITAFIKISGGWRMYVSTQRQNLSRNSQQHKLENVFLLLWLLVVQEECGEYEY